MPTTLAQTYEGELWYDYPTGTSTTQVAKVSSIPAVGAFSVDIPATTFQSNVVAELVVEPTGGDLVVSLTGLDEGFIPKYPTDPDNPENFIGPTSDPDSHAWFSTSDQISYTYAMGTSTLPRVFVTVINPSLDTDVDVEVLFRIRPQTPTLLADAGPHQSVRPGDLVTLDGTGSSAGVYYAWRIGVIGVAGCELDRGFGCHDHVRRNATLSDDTSQTPTFTAPDLIHGSTSYGIWFELTVYRDGLFSNDFTKVDISEP